jgi:hypothetical protein
MTGRHAIRPAKVAAAVGWTGVISLIAFVQNAGALRLDSLKGVRVDEWFRPDAGICDVL